MIVQDIAAMGNKLYAIRKRTGMTQADVAEATGLSLNTYAEIERGEVNTGVESIMQICRALHVTPDEFLVEDTGIISAKEEDILARLQLCSPKQKNTALRILEAYLQSIE
ncbi:MAG: helix-turn-helix transcriptional regulator [Clostridia bacterium]|nr:helix-turn-helix transcriptional regulator [Clostridia bacterium]